jgi:hypothetical protein
MVYKNKDQRIQPPFQNNVVEEVEEIDDSEDNPEIHFNDGELSSSHLTQYDYEDSLVLKLL